MYLDDPRCIDCACLVCPAGELTGSVAQKMYCGGCVMGFREYPGGTTCSPCLAGQELQDNKSIRNTGCVDCKPGYYAYTPALYGVDPLWPERMVGEGEKCEQCPTNTYSGPRAAVCITCPPGTTNNAARTACEPTSNPSPTRAPTTAAPTKVVGYAHQYLKCVPGQEILQGYSSLLSCSDCSKGYYSPFGIECIECPRGTYSTEARSTKCTQVPPGQLVNSDRTGGLPCQAGYYAPNIEGPATVEGYGARTPTRLSECTVCPPNMYAKAGQDRCDRCPDGTEVSASKDGCAPCQANYFKGSTTPVCTACPADTYSAEKASVCVSCPRGSKLNPTRTGCTTE
jgi:Tyrosine-protein kinase ephrin type A/B receptor-like